MRTKSRAQQVAQRTRQRAKRTRFTPRTRPVPVSVSLISQMIKEQYLPQIERDLNRPLWKSAGVSIPVSKGLLKDGGWT